MQRDAIRTELLTLLRSDSEVQAAIRQAAAESAMPLLAPVSAEEAVQYGLEAPPMQDEPALTEALECLAQKERQLEALRQQQAKMQDVMATYARLEAVYGDYLTLRSAWREKVGAMLNDSSPLAFAVTSANLTVLRGLHALLCEAWPQMTPQESAILNACLDLAFDLFLLGTSGYSRIATHEGEHVLPQLHAVTADSDPGKRIRQVIVAGFAGEDLCVRSLVRTGDYGEATI